MSLASLDNLETHFDTTTYTVLIHSKEVDEEGNPLFQVVLNQDLEIVVPTDF